MAVRAMWKGVVVWADVAVPVKLYAALQDRRVHFRLLHAADGAPVTQRLIDPVTELPVEREAVQKGFEVEPGRFVLLSDEDLAELTPPDSRDIAVERFVSSTALDDRWYDRSYWLGPDDDEASYFALARALAAEDKIGIVRWVMRKKRYQGALRVDGEHLMIVLLNAAETVVSADDFTAPSGRAPADREVSLAEQLVDALSGDFDPAEFPNEYQAAVRDLVAAKAEGAAPPRVKGAKRRASSDSLEDALAASLKAAGG